MKPRDLQLPGLPSFPFDAWVHWAGAGDVAPYPLFVVSGGPNGPVYDWVEAVDLQGPEFVVDFDGIRAGATTFAWIRGWASLPAERMPRDATALAIRWSRAEEAFVDPEGKPAQTAAWASLRVRDGRPEVTAWCIERGNPFAPPSTRK